MSEAALRRILALAVCVVFHMGFGVAVYKAPKPEPRVLPELQRVEVRTFEEDVELRKRMEEKPPPPPPEIEEPPPPPPPLPEALKPIDAKRVPEKPVQEAQAAPKRAPRPKKKKPNRKRKRNRSKPPKKTVVIASAMKGGGGPKVYGGEEDVFGNPEIGHSREAAEPDLRPSGTGPKDSKGTAATGAAEEPTRPPKIVAPRVLRKVKGTYPADAPRIGRTITVTLKLRIDATGKVTSARVVMKPTRAGDHFDAEARRVAKRTRFAPATRDGRPIPYSIRYRVDFVP